MIWWIWDGFRPPGAVATDVSDVNSTLICFAAPRSAVFRHYFDILVVTFRIQQFTGSSHEVSHYRTKTITIGSASNVYSKAGVDQTFANLIVLQPL